MNDLSRQYRQAPRLRSPATTDQLVLQQAQRRTQPAQRGIPRWSWAPAVSTMAIVFVGISLLWRNGVPPLTPEPYTESLPAATNDGAVSKTAQPPVDATVALNTETADMQADVSAPDEAASDFAGQLPSASVASQATASIAIEAEQSRKAVRSLAVTVHDSPAVQRAPESKKSLSVPDSNAAPSALLEEVSGENSELAEWRIEGEEWLRNQPGDQWTILISAQDKAIVARIADLGLPVAVADTPGAVVEPVLIIAGSFASHTSAQQIIAQLEPTALQPRVVRFDQLPFPLLK